MVDYTTNPDRPPLFVAVASLKQEIIFRNASPDSYVITPERPYVAVEYWKHGERLSENEGQKEVELAFQHSTERIRVLRRGLSAASPHGHYPLEDRSWSRCEPSVA